MKLQKCFGVILCCKRLNLRSGFSGDLAKEHQRAPIPGADTQYSWAPARMELESLRSRSQFLGMWE